MKRFYENEENQILLKNFYAKFSPNVTEFA